MVARESAPLAADSAARRHIRVLRTFVEPGVSQFIVAATALIGILCKLDGRLAQRLARLAYTE